MAETKYSYIISEDITSGKVCSSELTEEIASSDIVTELGYINTDEDTDTLDILMEDELSSGDETILNGIVLNHSGNCSTHTIREKNYQVFEYDKKQLSKETWYDTDDGDGSYSGLAEETTYTYNSNKLISETLTVYYYDGSVESIQTWNFFEDTNKKIKKRG